MASRIMPRVHPFPSLPWVPGVGGVVLVHRMLFSLWQACFSTVQAPAGQHIPAAGRVWGERGRGYWPDNRAGRHEQ